MGFPGDRSSTVWQHRCMVTQAQFEAETQGLIMTSLALEKCYFSGYSMIGLNFKRSHFIKSVVLI
jgi:hypothetical protein